MDEVDAIAWRTQRKWTPNQTRSSLYFVLMLLSSTLIHSCHGYDMTAVDVSNTSYYRELTRQNVVVVDGSHGTITNIQHLEQKRTQANETATNEGLTPSLNTETGLPVPFDTSLGSNFTDAACPQFFNKFLADPTFMSCLPMSLLLQNSMSFFQAARSKSLLTETLDKSCSASLAVCSPLMLQFAAELISPTYCEKDYLQQNPLVMQAYAGLNAYEPLYQATCLKTNVSGDYCFVEAMDSISADDSYPYYTAIGLQLPAGSKPTCSTCLHNTMEIFSGYAVQTGQSLSQTYLGCALQVNQQCGESFANTQVKSVSKVQSTSSGAKLHRGSILMILAVTVGIGFI